MRDQNRKSKDARRSDAIANVEQIRPARVDAESSNKKPRARPRPNYKEGKNGMKAREFAYTPEDYNRNEPGRKKRLLEDARSNAVPLEHFRADNETDQEIEDKIGFCCKHCACSEEDKQKYDGEFITDKETAWHRRCCHRRVTGEKIHAKTLIEYLLAVEEQMEGMSRKGSETAIVSFGEVNAKFTIAFNQQTELANEDSLEAPGEHLLTSERYREWSNEFTKIETRGPAVVVDAFAGIGSAIVVLKRLGIAIKKIIHIEHDKVANFVYKTNHDFNFVQHLAQHETELEVANEAFWTSPDYARQGRRRYYKEDLEDDGIEHVYYSKFEDVYERNDFVEEHGEIDIIIGGPPCIDYSAVNAYRKGINGREGKYMKKFGRFIQRIQQQQRKVLYYLVENVIIKGEDLREICMAYNLHWDPIDIDAKDFSPCRRRRHFFTNIPIALTKEDFRANNVKCDSCLDGDFKTAASIVDKTKDMIVKAQCFLASKDRIDDERMLVYRKLPNCDDYESRQLSVHERELMMGFPPSYVEFPVSHLFELLVRCGYSRAFVLPTSSSEADWRIVLPVCCHEFAGNFLEDTQGMPFKFKPWGEPGEDPELFLAHPRTAKSMDHLNRQEYAKRLVGNAFSIPTVELLLRPLQAKFEKRSYKGFDYNFKWEDVPAQSQRHVVDPCPVTYLPPVHERLKAALGVHDDSGNHRLYGEEPANDCLGAAEMRWDNMIGFTPGDESFNLESILGHSKSIEENVSSKHYRYGLEATGMTRNLASARRQGVRVEQQTNYISIDIMERSGESELRSWNDLDSNPKQSCYELQGFIKKPQVILNNVRAKISDHNAAAGKIRVRCDKIGACGDRFNDSDSSSEGCHYDSDVGKAYV